MIKSNLNYNLLKPFTRNYIQATNICFKISTSNFVIFLVHCPPRHAITEFSFKEFFNSLGYHFISCGDFKSKHPNWGSRVTNPKGKRPFFTQNYNFSSQVDCNFRTISPPFFTHWPASRRKRPDLLDFFIANSCNFYQIVEPLDKLGTYHASIF